MDSLYQKRKWFNTSKSVFLQDPSLENLVWKWGTDAFGAPLRISLDPSVIPASYGTTNDPKVSVDVLQLGDGYEQVTEVGIRSVQAVFSVNFGKKRPEVSLALQRFFQGEESGSIYERRPSEWFWFKVPFPFDTASALPRKFRCQTWSIKPETYSAITVTAQFIESFEP